MDERSAAEHIQKCHWKTQRPDELQPRTKALFDAGQLSRANVLRGIVGNAVSERGKRGNDEVIELHARGVARDDAGAEGVDHALQNNIADGNKALLQHTRNGNAQNPLQNPS